jgi:hypothetical protein
MDLNEFKRTLRKQKTKIKARLKVAERKSARAGQGIAVRLSSGTMTPADLVQRDHPYAVRHGMAMLPPEVINVISGGFRSAWKPQYGDWNGDSMTNSIVNDSPVAKYMAGTKYMLPRPIDEATAKILEPVRNENLQRALEEAL